MVCNKIVARSLVR